MAAVEHCGVRGVMTFVMEQMSHLGGRMPMVGEAWTCGGRGHMGTVRAFLSILLWS